MLANYFQIDEFWAGAAPISLVELRRHLPEIGTMHAVCGQALRIVEDEDANIKAKQLLPSDGEIMAHCKTD